MVAIESTTVVSTSTIRSCTAPRDDRRTYDRRCARERVLARIENDQARAGEALCTRSLTKLLGHSTVRARLQARHDSLKALNSIERRPDPLDRLLARFRRPVFPDELLTVALQARSSDLDAKPAVLAARMPTGAARASS